MSLISQTIPQEIDHFKKLPKDMLNIIFSYLDAGALLACARVCKKFREMAQNNSFWKVILPDINLPTGKEFFQFALHHFVLTKEGIIKRVADL